MTVVSTSTPPRQFMLSKANNTYIPSVGFGTYEIKNDQISKAIGEALKTGYRHFDCAWIYQNQEAIGKAVKQHCAEMDIARSELFITSKLWNTVRGYDNIIEACKGTLKELELEYLDLYLIHWPINKFADGSDSMMTDDELRETWSAMEKLVEMGLVKHIGVSNFTIPYLKTLLTFCKIRPVANEFEVHPLLPSKLLTSFCSEQNIQVIAYSSLGHGREGLLDDPDILDLSKSLKTASPGQLLLLWAIYKNFAVIPKSATPERIHQNYYDALVATQISAADLKPLDRLAETKQKRFCEPLKYWKSAGGLFTDCSSVSHPLH